MVVGAFSSIWHQNVLYSAVQTNNAYTDPVDANLIQLSECCSGAQLCSSRILGDPNTVFPESEVNMVIHFESSLQ